MDNSREETEPYLSVAMNIIDLLIGEILVLRDEINGKESSVIVCVPNAFESEYVD